MSAHPQPPPDLGHERGAPNNSVASDAVGGAVDPGTIRNRVSGPIGILVSATALAVLIGGWGFELNALMCMLPGFEFMKTNAALAFVLLGSALWTLHRKPSHVLVTLLAKALAGMGVAIGLATLLEYSTGWDLGFDQLVFAYPDIRSPYPGRMAIVTAVSLVLLGFSLISLNTQERRLALAGDLAAATAGFLGQVTFIRHLYGSEPFYTIIGCTAVPLHASAAIIALAVGTVLARTGGYLSRIILDDGIVGRTSRRLLPINVVTIYGLGQLRLLGQNWGLYGTEFGLSLFATSAITVLTGVLLWTAAALWRLDRAERRALRMARLRGEQFARLVSNIPGGVFTRRIAAAGGVSFAYASRKFGELFRIDPSAVLQDAHLLFDRIHPEDRADLSKSINAAAKAFEPWSREFRIVLPDKGIRWMHSQAAPYRTETGEMAWDGIVFDITDQKARDEQLRQAQKMEAVGQLTGGIAHDFNNQLMVILGNAEILREALSNDPKLKRHMEMTSAAAERCAELTQRLLAFSRRQPLQPKPVNVGALIQSMHALLSRSLGEHIEIVLNLDPKLWTTKIDAAQLESAILNLAVNARDAMPNGGKLTIEAANVEIDDQYARQNEGALPGLYVMVAVSDTGTGMPLEVAARAFEPFFTTKEVGKGTGLGLSMVYGFIKQSEGYVKIYSEPRHGTTVKLYLPRCTDGERPESSVRIPPRAANTGHETILMVEDDDLVRAHVEGQIAALGYKVHAARNGPDALEILRKNPDIDLLFTDIVLPGGMNGKQLAEEARRVYPKLKVLFTSGYTNTAFAHHGKLDPGVELLSKPYTREKLAARLRVVLDRPAS